MSDTDLSAVKQQLMERREQLLHDQFAVFRDCEAISDQNSADSFDRASAASDFAVAVNSASIESREIESIDEALRRIEEGKYGDCEGCEKPVPPARLEALPYARFCVSCQESYERSGEGVPLTR